MTENLIELFASYSKIKFEYENINHHPLLKLNQKPEDIIIAIGSGEIEKHKRLDPVIIINTIKLVFSKKKFTVGLVYGPSDLDQFQLWENLLKKNNISYISHYVDNFSTVLNVFSKSKLVITGCNGYSHIANLMGIKMVILYGPTNYIKTRPLSNNITILKTTNNCAPCYSENNIKGCDNPTCMSNYSIRDLEILKNTIEECL